MAESIARNLTRPVHVGNVTIGGGAANQSGQHWILG